MNMKALIILACLFLLTAFAGCDLRSDTAKREMEKFSGTPAPTISPTPAELPPDPSEVVQADVNLQGSTFTVNGYDQKKSVACTKLDRVMVSGGRSVVTIKGACRQIMINGDGNQIIGDAAIEIVVNGDDNTVSYSRYVNGKRPVIKDNAAGNTIEKVAASHDKH
jgi:hypothetical protein